MFSRDLFLCNYQKFPEGSTSKTFFGQYGTSYPEKLADANFIGMSVKSKKELALVGSLNLIFKHFVFKLSLSSVFKLT